MHERGKQICVALNILQQKNSLQIKRFKILPDSRIAAIAKNSDGKEVLFCGVSKL